MVQAGTLTYLRYGHKTDVQFTGNATTAKGYGFFSDISGFDTGETVKENCIDICTQGNCTTSTQKECLADRTKIWTGKECVSASLGVSP